MRPSALHVAPLLAALALAGCGDGGDRAGSAPDLPSGRITVEYRGGGGAEARFVREEEFVEDVADAVNEQVALPRDVEVVMGGDPDGPYYDPEAVTIQYPWSFVAETRRQLRANGYAPGKDLDTGVRDATMFVLVHEIAHALVDQLELPVLGREEDAADSFASYAAVEYADDGELVIAATDLFDAFDRASDLDEAAFFDSHSLDAQRFYAISCQVYGADPDEYANVVDGLGFDEERLAGCVEEWDLLESSWEQVLEPHLR